MTVLFELFTPIPINTMVMDLIVLDEFYEIEAQSNQYLWRNRSEICISHICTRNSGANTLLLQREVYFGFVFDSMRALFTGVNVLYCKEIQQFALGSNITSISHNIDFSSVNAASCLLWNLFFRNLFRGFFAGNLCSFSWAFRRKDQFGEDLLYWNTLGSRTRKNP